MTNNTNLTNRLQQQAASFGMVPSILEEAVTQAIAGKTVMVVAQQPAMAIRRLGYSIIESFDRWIIDWSNPKAPTTNLLPKASAKELRRLVDAFSEIREFFTEVEAGAGEAATFGLSEYRRGIPKRLDKKDIQFYLSRVYPTDDITIEKDQIVVRW